MSKDLVIRQSTELVKYTKEQFLKEFAPTVCLAKMSKLNSIEKAIKSDCNTLASLNKKFDRDFVINYLQLWIIDLNEFMSLTKPMNENQIKATAELIYQDNYSLNIADINLVFTNAKKGLYGQLYGSLDGSKILGWFNAYRLERSELFFENSFREHDIIKKHGHKMDDMLEIDKLCKLYGSLKIKDADGNKVAWHWDFVNNKARKVSDMTDEELNASEKAKREKAGFTIENGK